MSTFTSWFGTARHRAIAGVAAGAVVLGGGGAALALTTGTAGGTPAARAAATAPPTTTTNPAPPNSGKAATGKAGGKAGGLRALIADADHATIEVRKSGQWVTVTLDRGTVTAASSTSISLHRADGQSVTLAINGTTKFSGVSGATAIQTNKPAIVLSENGTALRVAQGKSPGSGQARTPSSTPSTTTPPSGT